MADKRVKGKPVNWSELKKPRTVTLTDTAWDKLAAIAEKIGISRSEWLERRVRDE
ncbi:hypothetical protein S7335_1188 [Synechococcus sp. PCC 7335]|nr:hypothetical protein S7335_1188 [Synechococcus sp. PCC 7335]